MFWWILDPPDLCVPEKLKSTPTSKFQLTMMMI